MVRKNDLNKMEMKEMNSDCCKSATKTMSKGRILKNLIIVCLGFLFQFSAYQALANLQSTLNIVDNLGVISQSIIYVALIVSALFLPKLVIQKLGCKMTLCLSILTYAPYVAANFYPHIGTFVPTSIIIGLGAAPLWAAKCTYINEISSMYASYGPDSVDVVTSKFFGIFFMMFQNTQIWGNLISFFVLKTSQSKNSMKQSNASSLLPQSVNISDIGSSIDTICGINFHHVINDNLIPPPEDKRYMLIGIYLGCVIIAALIVAVFLDPLKVETKDNSTIYSKVIATLKHLKKPQQMLLVPLTVFSGIEQAFILGDFTKAYVACTWGLSSVGLVFICFGVVNAILSFLSGRIVKYVSRAILMLIGAAGNISMCIVLYLWHPKENDFVYAFAIIGIWGLSDAVWQTQINALYGVLFRSEEEAAFSNYRLWESFGFAIAFAYSSILNVSEKIYILLAFLVVGISGYLTVEMKSKNGSYEITTSS